MEAWSGGLEGVAPARKSPVFKIVFLTAALFMAGAFLYMTPFGGSARAQTYLTPHGAYSSHTQLCEICHATHEAPGAKLVKGSQESALCFTCHNGTGSNYNTEIQMNLNPATNSMHPLRVSLPNNPGTYNYSPRTTAGIAPPGPYECSQCHNPHGDVGNGMLLRGSYSISEYVTYAPAPNPYEICWSCHRTSDIVDDTVYFPKHNRHIVQLQTPCTACHASPHGVANTDFVRFNTRFVTASVSQAAGPSYVDNGVSHGTCTLTCHGVDHAGFSY